jgi:endonuclease/exonuclease/phosphatase family metal-dependent hydrolase
LSGTAEAISSLNVDIIGLQEVDNLTERHKGDDQMKILSKMTNLPFYKFGKMRDFQGL